MLLSSVAAVEREPAWLVEEASLLEAAQRGEPRAVGRVLSTVEDDRAGGSALLAELFRSGGGGYVIGITGPPGAGKSTLTDQLIRQARAEGLRVGVVAVDPTSPFSGGALLGDRVRMQDHAGDPGVYIRSVASRGHLGGLAAAVPKLLTALDGLGFSVLAVETVGVGQAEIEIVEQADTTVVVVNPGWGDSIQAAKAGLLEIADVLVVNKADRPGLEATVADLNGMLDLASHLGWRPPVLATVAIEGRNLDELWNAIAAHRSWLEETGELQRRRNHRLGRQLSQAVADIFRRRSGATAGTPRYDLALAEVTARRIDPWTGARRMLDTETEHL